MKKSRTKDIIRPLHSETEYQEHENLLRRTWSGRTCQLMENQTKGPYAHVLLKVKAPPLHNGNYLDPKFTQPPPSNTPKHANELPNGLIVPAIYIRNTSTLKHRIKHKKYIKHRSHALQLQHMDFEGYLEN